jgi:ActR/RegA family two-component response regulator
MMPGAHEVILLVDDIRDHAVNYEAALTRHGFEVRVATTGEEALRLAREGASRLRGDRPASSGHVGLGFMP